MTAGFAHPTIIQGGMGVGVSDWVLAKAVSMRGQLGVVSGTALDSLIVRRLQDGDIGGHVRRALEHFPIPGVSADMLARYFLPEGRPDGMPYKPLAMYKQVMTTMRRQITMAANFVEVYLAKEGHDGPVGINLLTKVQLPNLDSLYGAMLAGVDYVLMGAGIPKDIPGALDRFARGEAASIKLDVDGIDRGETQLISLDPRDHWEGEPPALKRPFFLPIIASNSLGTMLSRKANGRVDGFIIEGPTAGGHNAPPRGDIQLNDRGEPIYGERDVVDLEKICEIGLPFWVAGGAGAPERLQEVLDKGATGVQVGTLFAYAEESGLSEAHKQRVIQLAHSGGSLDVLTDFRASPTGFPFKVVQLGGSMSDPTVYERRERVCDLGYLRTAFKQDNGRIGYRCPAEPVDVYVKKGGDAADTVGRKCLCNALMADIGYGQVREDGEVEKALLTSGDDLKSIRRFLGDRTRFSAGDVIDYLLSGVRGYASSASLREPAHTS